MPSKYKDFDGVMFDFEGWHRTKVLAQKSAEESRKRYGMKARVVKVDGMWCVYSSPKFTKKEREDQEKIERGLTMYGR
jgi:transposase